MNTNSSNNLSTIKFTIESRILKELGERLVNDSSIALTELIKNSYDADASECEISISNDRIIIKDNGHGMSFDEFKNKWMKIATANKLLDNRSKIYNRNVTGSKGIGRFAVRFLGKHLTLESISKNEENKNIKLVATFDWDKLDENNDLTTLEVPYQLIETTEKCGTKLIITKLRNEASLSEEQIKKVKSNVIQNTSPIFAFIQDIKENLLLSEKSIYKNVAKNILNNSLDNTIDPGFDILFNQENSQTQTQNLASLVLKNYVISAKMFLEGNNLKIIFSHNIENAPLIPSFEINNFDNKLGTSIYTDIRFFPKRGGVFSNKGVNGLAAWTWVKSNHGIKVFDHGFSITPYGHDDDDWLHLDRDSARSLRHWRTELMQTHFPMDIEDANSTKRNPMLALPNNHQLIGAIFVNSDSNKEENTLLPSMDRQGYVINDSFKQLTELTRFVVELIAYYDKKISLQLEEEARQKRYGDQIHELEAVIREIESSPTLMLEDKERIIEYYSKVKENVEDLGNYDKEARESLETMSLLGVVAGFMTHEYEAALGSLEEAKNILKQLSDVDPKLGKTAEELQKIITNFNGYIEYTQLFVQNIHLAVVKPYKSLSVLKLVTNTFENFMLDRNINLKFEISRELQAPLIPVAMYQGLVLNLFTNALKALVNETHEDKKIIIQAWNESKKHIIQVVDNGPGIPDDVKNRIWDPLYTTTSKQNNSLGSGMGLGLALVKRVVESQKGKINLISPPANYSTCFRIELPFNAEA